MSGFSGVCCVQLRSVRCQFGWKDHTLWQHRVGKGGLWGGIQWGSAADAKQVYVALSDIGVSMVPESEGGPTTQLDSTVGDGMFALDIETGARNWHVPPPGYGDKPRCSPAQSAVVSALPGVIFSGPVDGHLRGYDTATGEVVWDYDARLGVRGRQRRKDRRGLV